jgi:hypothetical protein
MRNIFALFMTTVLAALLLVGCAAPAATGSSGDGSGDVNFRLLISDQPNAIDDFEELWVTISRIDLVPAADSNAGHTEIVLDPVLSVNLVELVDENAVAAWEGYIPEGEYSKVFLYVDSVDGLLVGSDDPINIKLPSNKLQLDYTFTVNESGDGDVTEFVYDITVIRAGNSGMYLLLPQLGQSGPDQRFKEQVHTEKRVSYGGPPEWVASKAHGKPVS